MGHARALLTLPSLLQVRLASQAAEYGWSVRELEAEARKAQAQPEVKSAPRRDANVQSLENEPPNASPRAYPSNKAAVVAANWSSPTTASMSWTGFWRGLKRSDACVANGVRSQIEPTHCGTNPQPLRATVELSLNMP